MKRKKLTYLLSKVVRFRSKWYKDYLVKNCICRVQLWCWVAALAGGASGVGQQFRCDGSGGATLVGLVLASGLLKPYCRDWNLGLNLIIRPYLLLSSFYCLVVSGFRPLISLNQYLVGLGGFCLTLRILCVLSDKAVSYLICQFGTIS